MVPKSVLNDYLTKSIQIALIEIPFILHDPLISLRFTSDNLLPVANAALRNGRRWTKLSSECVISGPGS